MANDRKVRDESELTFYRDGMQLLLKHNVPFLVGGAWAMAFYTGIKRNTKDLDLYVSSEDIPSILDLFHQSGYRVEKRYSHWLAKIFDGDDLIDLIYRAGNGLCKVDDSWLERAQNREMFGVQVRVAAPEELIWMKAYIMERERYDGADVAHFLLSCADQIDWKHLLARFGEDWPVLLVHLVLFNYIYPSERHRLPSEMVQTLIKKMRAEVTEPAPQRVCRGTLLSRAQYLIDVERGFRDARLDPRCKITAEELQSWTAAIPSQSGIPIRRAR